MIRSPLTQRILIQVGTLDPTVLAEFEVPVTATRDGVLKLNTRRYRKDLRRVFHRIAKAM